MALWLFVLVADTAVAGSVTAVGYVLTGVVALAFALAGVWAVTARSQQPTSQPVRVRVRDHPYGRR